MSNLFKKFAKSMNADSVRGGVHKALEGKRYSFKSIFALSLFVMIIAVFVLFGSPTKRLGSPTGGMIAEVNNILITTAEFREESQRIEQMYNSMFPGMDLSAQRQFLQQRALANLITAEVISQGAERENIYSPDGEIRDFLVNDIKAFQEEGQFQKERYEQYINATRTSFDDFENKIRKDRKRNRTLQVFEMGVPALALQLAKEKELDETQINVSFARMDKEQLLTKLSPSTGEISAFLGIAENAKKVEENYKVNRMLYVEPEQIKASHILIKTKPGDAAAATKAEAKLLEIKKKIESGSDFATLAKQESEDEGSKEKGGDLGFFGHGQMVEAFEKAAFGNKIGDLVGPVKSNFGYHLIKVVAKHERKELGFEEAKTKIASKMMSETKFEDQIKLVEGALGAGDNSKLDEALKSLGVVWADTGLFGIGSETVPQLGTSAPIKEAIFKMDQVGAILPKLVRDSNLRYVMKLKESKIVPNEKVTAKSRAEKLQHDGGTGLFEAWHEQVRSDMKIKQYGTAAAGAPAADPTDLDM